MASAAVYRMVTTTGAHMRQIATRIPLVVDTDNSSFLQVHLGSVKLVLVECS